MDVTIIQQAVTMLQQQGKAVSVRSVHQHTGGSFRDISRLLRELRLSASQSPSAQQPQHTAAVTQEPHASQQAPAATLPATTPRLSPEVLTALAAYQQALADYEEMRQRDWKRSPLAPDILLVPLWRKVEEAKRRCLALGVNPE